MSKLFGTSGIRGGLEKVSPDLAMKLGLSLASALGNRGSVAVGYDARLSSPLLAHGLSSGLMSGGCDAVQLGPVATPVLAFATREKRLDAGVMITGSHNPPSDNGLKCYTRDGREYTTDEEEPIETLISNASYGLASWDRVGSRISLQSATEEYCETLTRSIEPVKREIHVVVDCANSVGSKITPRALAQIGCRVTTVNANIDGTFPGRSPEPTAETLAPTSEIVRAVGGDLCIAHDADADRISVLDEKGRYVTNDRLLAFFASLVLKRHGPGTIVTSVDTSLRIDEVAERYGGRVKRTRLGKTHEFIKMGEPDLRLCCEPWKIIDPSWGYWGDAVYAACELASNLADGRIALSEMLGEIPDYPQSRTSYQCPNEAKSQVMSLIQKTLAEDREAKEVWAYDGVRVNYDDGSWILVRPSGTEPKIRAYCEARSQARLDELVKRASTLVAKSTRIR